MPKTHVISDSHFFHENIIKYCDRPFASVEEQNETQIANWNQVVAPEDTVIHCGDFIMGPKENIHKILPRLNGNIILCRGNHDLKNKLPVYAEYCNKIIVKELHYMEYKGLFFAFCHFPNDNKEFHQMVVNHNTEVVWCHGHIHNEGCFHAPASNTFNCSADVTGFTPVGLDDLWAIIRNEYTEKGAWKGK